MTPTEPSTTGSRNSPGRLPAWAVATIVFAALVTTWLIARNALILMFAQSRPTTAVAMFPASGHAQAALALQRVVAADGVVDAEGQSLLRSAIGKAPLSADPFVLAGLDASAKNKDRQAQTFFEEAERRDPRSMIARYWLFDDYMQNGEFAKGLAEADPTIALQSQTRAGIVSYLSALLDVAAARPALIAALKSDPSWRRGFFAAAFSSPAQLDRARQIMAAAPSRNASEAAQEQQMLVMALFNAQRFDAAHQLWLEKLPPVFQSQARGIYDGNFEGWPGGLPFNWRFPEAQAGVAVPPNPSHPDEHGLQIHYSGDDVAMLAVQSLLATAGRKTLSFTLSSSAEDQPGGASISVRVYCDAVSKAILDTSISDIGQKATVHQLPFDVQPGCKAITVQFLAQPGISPGPLEASLTDVKLVQSSGS